MLEAGLADGGGAAAGFADPAAQFGAGELGIGLEEAAPFMAA